MKPFLLLRALVYLKRISRSLERIAQAQENASVAIQIPKTPRMAEVFVPTVDQINEMYEEE